MTGPTRTETVDSTAAAIPRRIDPVAGLKRAASDAARPLDPVVQRTLAERLGHDFGRVRIHDGPASAAAAAHLGARAYTLGADIHLGADARSLGGRERFELLAHEAVHAVQQGGGTVVPHASLAVSEPADAAEREAREIAASLRTAPSRSLALRDQLRAGVVTPRIQRDLTDKFKVAGGEFKLDLKTNSNPGGVSGMRGTIKFKAAETAPDSNNIRLMQAVKLVDLNTGKDKVWEGDEADRNKVMTAEDKSTGLEGGWFIDHSAAKADPRTKKTDPAVSPYYRDYWPNPSSSQDGSKKGKKIVEASLWDGPGSNAKREFSFETVAKAADTGTVYGTVMWGFRLPDPAKGTVEKERAVGRDVTLLSTDKALEKFNEFYRNPGASTAP